MIPLYKAFSLIIRVFSRPMINYTKKMHSNNTKQDTRIRIFFIWFGNFYHRIDNQINKKFLKIQSEFAFKPLNEELAIQKGIQFFYQIIFYIIVIGLPLYEMYRASQETKEKADHVTNRLNNVQDKIVNILDQIQSWKNKQRQLLQSQANKIGIKMQDLSHKHLYCFPSLKIHFQPNDTQRQCNLIEYKMCLL